MKKIISIISISSYLIVSTFTLGVQQVNAGEFDPSFIISNNDVNDYKSMTVFEIQSFLINLNSFLAGHITKDTKNILKSATGIIYEAAQNNKINPKWILATLQKEQSLVAEKDKPDDSQLDWAMGYAVCDNCSKSDSSIQRFKGFGKQVNSASAQMRYYMDNPNEYKFKAGQLSVIDGKNVFIKNTATAAMYSYTPHIHGNKNFYNIWSRWFTTVYPDGSLVKVDGENVVWYIQNGKRRVISSTAILYSIFGDQDILTISKVDLENYPLGLSIKFPNYSLVKSLKGDLYLLDGLTKKKIESMEVFRKLGFKEEELIDIPDVDLNTYKEARMITMNSIYPTGQLIQDIETGGVFFVQDGFKYPIVNREVLKNRFANRTIIKGDKETLSGFITAQKVRFKDGSLIKEKGKPDVYVIVDEKRKKIANEYTFNTLGYSWSSIIETNHSGLTAHPLGDPINLSNIK